MSSQGQVKVVLAVLVSLLPPLLLASPFLFHMRELAPRLHDCQTHFLPGQATNPTKQAHPPIHHLHASQDPYH
jgi:hypothetical protein